MLARYDRPVTEIEIGRGKRGRRAYSFDDIAVVPSRRTRDPEEVSVSWQIDAYHFDIPVIAAPMDSVMSPETAIALGKFGGLGVLNLEGLWTRYDDPTPLLEQVLGQRVVVGEQVRRAQQPGRARGDELVEVDGLHGTSSVTQGLHTLHYRPGPPEGCLGVLLDSLGR